MPPPAADFVARTSSAMLNNPREDVPQLHVLAHEARVAQISRPRPPRLLAGELRWPSTSSTNNPTAPPGWRGKTRVVGDRAAGTTMNSWRSTTGTRLPRTLAMPNSQPARRARGSVRAASGSFTSAMLLTSSARRERKPMPRHQAGRLDLLRSARGAPSGCAAHGRPAPRRTTARTRYAAHARLRRPIARPACSRARMCRALVCDCHLSPSMERRPRYFSVHVATDR